MRNEGTLDRALRGIVGLILLALAWLVGIPLFEAGWAVWGATLVSLVLIATAATGFCPGYRLLGLKTCEDC